MSRDSEGARKTSREPDEPLHIAETRRSVRIRPLKEWVLARFPEDHPLREVILAEKDVLTAAEFLAKMEVWTVLLNRRA